MIKKFEMRQITKEKIETQERKQLFTDACRHVMDSELIAEFRKGRDAQVLKALREDAVEDNVPITSEDEWQAINRLNGFEENIIKALVAQHLQSDIEGKKLETIPRRRKLQEILAKDYHQTGMITKEGERGDSYLPPNAEFVRGLGRHEQLAYDFMGAVTAVLDCSTFKQANKLSL